MFNFRHISIKRAFSFMLRPIKLPLIIFIALLFMIGFLLLTPITPFKKNANSATKISLPNAKSRMNINKNFSFPIRDQEGKEVSSLKYEILNAELRDQIIVKGETATAVMGRGFLIINLKLNNEYDKSLQINAKDFLRLIVNKSGEKLAPEIHNDPVDVQAISTKYTRLGFPIDDNYKSLNLEVGEIQGKKEIINLTLK